MKKDTVKKILKYAVIAMIACTFFFGGFSGLKTEVNDWLNPSTSTTQTPAE